MPFPKARPGPLTQDRLHELLHYDEATGHFTRKVTTAARAVAGTVAGDVDSKGYWRLRVDCKRYLAHRLAWFYVHGEWPEEIDHKNRVRTDNRLSNLRSADRFMNKHNTKCHKDNLSTLKGVSFHAPSKRWRARIHVNGGELWLGAFDTPEEAHGAYVEAARKHYGEFARAA